MITIQKYFFILLFAAVASACGQKTEEVRSHNANAISFGSEATLSCEKQLRANIDQNKILLAPEIKLQKQIDEVNGIIPISVEQKLMFTEIDNQIQEFIFLKNVNVRNKSYEISMMVGLNKKNAIQPMYFEITSTLKLPSLNQTLRQRYSVNTSCNLNLQHTTYTEFKKTNEKDIFYSTLEISDGEVIEQKTDAFSVPDGKTDIDFALVSSTSELIDIAVKTKNPVILIPFLGFIDLQFAFKDRIKEFAFGHEFNFDRFSSTWKLNGKIISDSAILVDEASKVSYSFMTDGKGKSWTVPSSFKDQIYLGQVQFGNEYFDSKINTNYQQFNNSYILKTNKPLDYDHFRAYYTYAEINKENDLATYNLQEVYPPVIQDNTIPADLESNSTIQTDLPEIQKISGDILKVAKTRKEQISNILKYLADNYSYDYEMLNKDTVRPLSTKEALDRKKGVCQHYAVLFTAIARAMKIPSRIVNGYLINGDKPGLHAWVEAEVSENLWQVIEPQSADGLLNTRTRFYFPISRARFLEDKNSNFSEEFMKMNNSKYIVQPI